MVPNIAAALAGLMMLFVAARGLRPTARAVERLYTTGVVGWSAFAIALFHPATFGRLVPVGLAQSHLVLSVFGFGLIALAAFGASLMIGGK